MTRTWTGHHARRLGRLAVRTALLVVAFASWSTAGGADGQPDLSSPLVHWRLDDAMGSLARDASVNSHDAVLGGPGARWTRGRIGGALRLDGSAGAAAEDPAGAALVNGLDAFTVTLWIRSRRTGTDRGFLTATEPDGEDGVLSLRYDAAGARNGNRHRNLIKAGITTTGGGQEIESSPGRQTTAWQFVALAWRSGESLRLYVDGRLDEPTHNSPPTHGVITGATLLRIGQGTRDAARSWDGLVDDVRLYDRVLGDDELRALHLEGAGLLAHWTLDEGSGALAADSSGRGHDAALVGSGLRWADGRIGGALDFDGRPGAFVEDEGAVDDLDGLGELTVALWVKSRRTGTNRGFLFGMAMKDGEPVLGLRYDAAGARNHRNLIRAVVTATGGSQEIESSPGLQSTEWQHVALTWRSGEPLRLYVDGRLDRPSFGTRPTRGALARPTALRLGGGAHDLQRGWDGLLDDVRVYGRALDASEIAELARAGDEGAPLDLPGAGPTTDAKSSTAASETEAGAPLPSAPVTAGERRDLAEYMFPRTICDAGANGFPSTRVRLGEHNKAFRIFAGRGSSDESAPTEAVTFYMNKGDNGEGFEEWRVGDEDILILRDTTWSNRDGQDMICGPGTPTETFNLNRRSCQQDPGPCSQAYQLQAGVVVKDEFAYTLYEDAAGRAGAPWLKRFMPAGSRIDGYEVTYRIRAKKFFDCLSCEQQFDTYAGAPGPGETAFTITRPVHVAHLDCWPIASGAGRLEPHLEVRVDGSLPPGATCEAGAFADVVRVRRVPGGEGGPVEEFYYYQKDAGWIGYWKYENGSPLTLQLRQRVDDNVGADPRIALPCGKPFGVPTATQCLAVYGGAPPPPDDDPCPAQPGSYCSLKALSLCVRQGTTLTKSACGAPGCIEEPAGTADHCGTAPVCQGGVTRPASPVARALPASLVLRLPFDPGTQVALTQAYGPGTQGTHTNIDGARWATWPADYYALDLVPTGPGVVPEGTPIVAAAAGTVRTVGWEADGYGNFVVIQHSPPHQQYYSFYGHMRDASLRNVGDVVAAGDRIGLVGRSGAVTGPHLHFAVHFNQGAPEQDGHKGAVAVVPEPIDGYGCLSPRVGDVLLAGNGGGVVHTRPVAISQSTTLRRGDLYHIPSTNTALVRNPGVLTARNQQSSALFPVAAFEIDGRSGITLDCNGVWIQSEAGDLTRDRSNDKLYEGVGIRVRNSTNVTVRNCNVAGYRYGVLVEDSTGVSLEANRTTHNYRNFTADFFMDSASIPSHHFGGGIRVWRGRGVRVVGNHGDNQMSGIELVASDDNEVSGNRFNYDQVGLYLSQSSRNRIESNDFDWGIRFETRTWRSGSSQTLEKGGVYHFLDRGLLRVQDDGSVGGFPVKRLLRLMDRDTAQPYWDLATMTLDAAGVLFDNSSNDNQVRRNSLKYGGDGLFIRANGTPCSTGNLVEDNDVAFSPNNGLELSFCDGTFRNNRVYSNNHGMWLGAGAHDVALEGNQFANNLSYGVLGTRNGAVRFEGNTVADTPVAIAMQAERWGGSLNLPADGTVVPSRDWSVHGNAFRRIRGGAYPWMLLGAADGAVFRLSGVERFTASGNTFESSDRCLLPHPSPAPGTPPNAALSLDCGAGGEPAGEFLFPTDGSRVQGGAHHTFVCRGTDDKALRSVEIVFNNEHRKRCDYAQSPAVKTVECRFENFYVGADLEGRTIPMACNTADWDGKTGSLAISVKIGHPQPYRVRFVTPTDGQRVPPGHNNFTCEAADDKSLKSIEILFNNEHRHRCSFGPVTSGSCTFANFYVGSDLLGKTIPMRCTADDLDGNRNQHDINVVIGSDDTTPPTAQFVTPTNGATVQPAAHHTFVCRGTDDKALRSVEIVFNDEHRKRCDYAQAAATKSADCRFESFYVGADMNGKTVPMACQAQDWAGRSNTHSISVKIGATDTRAPYVQFQRPTTGATIQPGYNDFTCYASDDKSLKSIEILFNNEHRYQCNYGPVTSGSCTFSRFYVGVDMNGRTVPMRCTARDLAGNQSQHDLSVQIGSSDTRAPYVQFQRPTAGTTIQPGYNDFTCYASDDKSLKSIEILFNNEHRYQCNYGPVTSSTCTFSRFYVGTDMNGRTVPMRCTARDLAGNTSWHEISVGIGSSDTQAPYVQFQRPTSGATIHPGFNDFTCYASDGERLQSVEILFNNEHRHSCSYGAATSGTCTFAGFYVGADLLGRTIPMRCTARDAAGNQRQHDISVRVQSPPT